MHFEQYNPEEEKQFIQSRIFEILEKKPEEIKKLEKFEIQATIPVEKEKLNWHDNFLALMEPRIKDAKILDLFCGSNSIKRYFQEKNLKGEVTGVDISTEKADIKADVAEIEKVLKPEKQFDIVCSFGAVPGVVNYETIQKYLKENGFFITQSSAEVFYENIQPVLENKELNPQNDFSQETKRQLEYFQPRVLIEVQGVKDFINEKPSNDVYIFWQKKNEYSEITSKEQIWRQEKEDRLNKIRQEVDKIVDAIGTPIDSNIKETVVMLMALGFPTSASCEGHVEVEHGFGAPWVEISAPNEPEERFIGEKEIYQKVAEKYGISLEDVKRARHYEAWVEAFEEFSKNDETPEYKKWRKENKKLMAKAKNLLTEFYKNRKVASNVRLRIERIGAGGCFRIHNGGKDYREITKEEKLTKEQIEIKKERLKQYQKEMQDFAEFLKKKYFE